MRDNANKNDRKFKSTITEFFKDYFLINYEYVCLSVGMCVYLWVCAYIDAVPPEARGGHQIP